MCRLNKRKQKEKKRKEKKEKEKENKTEKKKQPSSGRLMQRMHSNQVFLNISYQQIHYNKEINTRRITTIIHE